MRNGHARVREKDKKMRKEKRKGKHTKKKKEKEKKLWLPTYLLQVNWLTVPVVVEDIKNTLIPC